ncbi:hypothetical protein NEAUS07_1209 [Nematocida ausubeli]|nr:hypothetical protein NEAUS07_1209 [Nematocida ausubeli]
MEYSPAKCTPGLLHAECIKASKKPSRAYLYNGETVWVEGVFDGVKVSLYTELKLPAPQKERTLSSQEMPADEASTSDGKELAPEIEEATSLNGIQPESPIPLSIPYIEEQTCAGYEYISGNRPYYIPCTAQIIRFDYLEFLKSIECPEHYCISNVINNTEEVILKSELFSVVPPFQIVEKVQGNYLIVSVIPDKALAYSLSDQPTLSINGNRMEYKGNSLYKIKLLQIADWSGPFHISVDFEQIHYTRELSLSLPNEFMYSVGLKKIEKKTFIKLTLCRVQAASYEIVILNPLVGETAQSPAEESSPPIKQTSLDMDMSNEYCADVSAMDLLVGASNAEIFIDSPDAVTEILLEVQKRDSSKQQYVFSAKVNNYLIEFFVKL